jgi:uncharacterized protein YgiM (DUF1202 family)
MRATTMGAVVVVTLVAGLAGAQTPSRWVERTKADVRGGKGSFHDIVDTVVKGEQVQIVRTEDKWLFVRTPRAKQGYVFAAALSTQPVTGGGSNFLKMAPGDASTSATAASAGAKGIYAEQYARQKGFDYGVVRWVEDNQPPAGSMEAFVKDGGLQ